MSDAQRQKPPMPPAKAGVKRFIRYANRKLYDPSRADYISSRELLDAIMREQPFEIYSHDLGVDVTGPMMTQLLALLHRRGVRIDLGKILDLIRESVPHAPTGRYRGQKWPLAKKETSR